MIYIPIAYLSSFNILFLPTSCVSFCLLAAASAAYASFPKKKPSVIPVDKVMTHDPVMAKQGDTYYLFATGHGISVMSSKDLKNWKFEKPVFEKAPQWSGSS
jgi:arabinan endo-1,5-alpha-L-arabinosidase